jgi:hypothetical protein
VRPRRVELQLEVIFNLLNINKIEPEPTRYPVTDWLIRHDGHVMVSERRGSIASRRCPQAVQTKRPLHNGAVTEATSPSAGL